MPSSIAETAAIEYGWKQLARKTGRCEATVKKWVRRGAPSYAAATMLSGICA